MEKLYCNTPIGYIEAPSWEVAKIIDLSDEDLILKAVEENKAFCISPTTYALIEKRQLSRLLQHVINPEMGFMRHDLPEWACRIRLV